MDGYAISLPVERTPSSSRAFGDWSLALPEGPDAVPREIFFADPAPSAVQRELLREAYRRLLRGVGPRVLELAAGREPLLDLPPGTALAGLSAEPDELRANPSLADRVIHDLNEEPRLPFPDAAFDAVLVPRHVGRLRRPLEVFREVHRVLAPSGLAVVSFLHPHFDARCTRMWAFGDDRDHVVLAESFLLFSTRGFTRPSTVALYDAGGEVGFAHGGLPPEDAGRPRVFVVWAAKGAPPAAHVARPPFPPPAAVEPLVPEVRRDASGRPTCIWCGEPLVRYAPPVTVFEIDYGVAELHVCFSDRCPYYRRSKHWMRLQGHPGYVYRFSWNPATGASGPIPDNLAGGLSSGRLE